LPRKSTGSAFYVTVGWIGSTYESTAIGVTSMAQRFIEGRM
jgi:hypothetical protein